MTITIRPALSTDSEALRAIYAPYVEHTSVSFEAEVPSAPEFAARLARYAQGWACLVAESGGEVAGYAYGSPHRERAAYRWSVETSVYIAPQAHRQGIGRALYAALLPMLRDRGYANAYAGVALPNDASVGLHRALGFNDIGCFPRVGWKHGAWHDVAWFHRALRDGPPTDIS